MSLTLHFLSIVALLVLAAFFSAAETALFSLSKLEKRRIKENHPTIAKWIMDHLEHPRRTLITILIGNLFTNILATAIATLVIVEYWGSKNLGLGMTAFTLCLILFAEIIPKVFAVRKDEKTALITALPLHIASLILSPFRFVTRVSTDFVMGLMKHEFKKDHHHENISEDELRTLVKIGEEEGVLDQDERRMLQKLLDLGERPVKAIMTPRTDLAALDILDPAQKNIEIIKKFHFSEFPVYQDTKDHILGVVSVQEFMLSSEKKLQPLIREPLFIPETKRIDDLLTEFRQKNQTFAVCVDEYGGTAGIVTLEDILEEIFGEFYDEYAKVEKPIRPYGNHEFLVEAKISLKDFNDFFSTHLESEESATLAGYILERLGELPEKEKNIELTECHVRIHDVIRNRIKTVIVRPPS